MTKLKAFLVAPAALCLVLPAAPASADPIKNIVLVHGAWVDASGWKPVYEILTKQGFHVTMVQEPETSFADDVTATKRILDLQDGPTILVGHSYGGSIITEAGVHPNVVGLVYVAAHAPDVGEDEGELGKKTPSVLAKTEGAIKVTPDKYTYLNPADFPELFAPDLPREHADFESRSQILAATSVFNTPLTAAAWKTKPSWGIVAGRDTLRVERSVEETRAGLRLKPPKTKRGRRSISLGEGAITALRGHRLQQMQLRLAIGAGAIQPTTPVFSTIEGELLSPDNLSRDWCRVRTAKKLPPVPFHALRHTHASMLIRAGVDILSISRRLGHSKAAMTLDVYGHLIEGSDAAAARAIEEALK